MWVGDDMWIDLSTKKITFSTWKITIDATAKIANHVTTRYYLWVSYSTAWTWTDCDTWNWWTQCTACPAWMHVFNNNSWVAPNQTGTTAYMWTTPKTMATSWTFYCWTKWT